MAKQRVILEIQVFGIDGLPLVNRNFKLRFPDGKEIEGKTDGSGYINQSIPYVEGLTIGFNIDIGQQATEDNFGEFQNGEIFNDPEIPFVDVPELDLRGIKKYDPEGFDVKDKVVLNVCLVDEPDSTLGDSAEKYGTTLETLKAENEDEGRIVFLSKSINQNFSLSKGGPTVA